MNSTTIGWYRELRRYWNPRQAHRIAKRLSDPVEKARGLLTSDQFEYLLRTARP